MAFDSLTGCSIMDTIMPPNCNCPILAAPLLPADTTICSTDSIPSLMAVADTNQVVHWYSQNAGGFGGFAVDTSFSFTLTVTDTLIVQGQDTITGCLTEVDTFVFIRNNAPTITLQDTICTADLDTFNLEIGIGNFFDTIITNHGIVTFISGNDYMITGVPSDSTLVITVSDTTTSCSTTLSTVISCNCLSNINPPVAAMDTLTVCLGDSATMIVAIDSTETADWFNAADSLLVMGDTIYATNITGTYQVITRDTVSGCPSADTTVILLQNHPLPALDSIYNNVGPYCITDSIQLIGDTLSNIVYAWTTNGTGMISDTTLQAPIITGAGNGEIFTLTVTDTLTGCSNMIQDTVLVDSIPTISSIVATCDASLDSFSVQIFTNGTTLTIMSAHGALAPGNNPYTIIGIPADSLLFVSLSFGTGNSCKLDTLIAGLNCDCPMLNLPTVMDTVSFCTGDTLPPLLAQVDSSETVDWYSTAGATGTPLLVGDTLFQPTMVGTYYALTRDTITGCVSDTTAAIVVQATPLPSFSAIATTSICVGDSVNLLATSVVGATTWQWTTTGSGGITNDTAMMATAGGVMNGDQFILTGTDANGCSFTDTTNAVMVLPATAPDTIYTACTPDLNDYIVYVITSAGTPTASIGTVTNIGMDTFQIGNIPTTMNVTLTLADSNNCVYTQLITAPNCACPQTLTAPVISDLTICQDNTPFFQAVVGPGETVNWFDTIVGGIPLAVSPTFTSSVTAPGIYTFYAQTVNSLNGCVSAPRTPVTLTILPLPNPNLPAVTTVCSGTTTTLTPGLFTSYFWSTGDTTAAITQGAGQYFVTVTDNNGCTAVQVATVEEDTGQALALTLPAMACTSDGAFALTGGSPAGGAYIGPGVTNGMFDPVAAGVGTHTISYSIGGNCTGSATATITVMAPSAINLSLATTNFCETDGAVTLNGSPTGGIYSGAGITNNTFSPVGAGVGTHTLVYTVGVGTTCEVADTLLVSVTAPPVVSFSPPMAALCNVSTPFTLSGGLPVGGTYSGTGVTGNVFDPVAAGTGTHTLSYTVVSGTCSVTATAPISVQFTTATTLTIGNINFCETDGSIALGGNPAGGVFSGPGVSSNVFSPSAAGPGTHTLVYSLGAGTGCGMSDSILVSVTAAPTLSFNPGGASTICNTTGAFTLSGGSPAGGIYSGAGVSGGNVFDPTVAGLGTHTLTYTLNSGGCTAAVVANYTVVSQPTVSLSLGNANVCDNGGSITLSGGSPAGGTYSGPNVSGGVFNPTGLGAGPYTITYTYSLGAGCSGSASA